MDACPVQHLATVIEFGDNVLGIPAGTIDLCGLPDLDAVTDADRPAQFRVGTDHDISVQRDGQLPTLDGGALAHRQLTGDDGAGDRGLLAQVRVVSEMGAMVELDLHAVADPDTFAPGGAAEQPGPAADLKFVTEAALQAAATADAGAVTDDRFGLDLRGLAESDLVSEAGRVADDRPVVQLTAFPDRGTLIDGHLVADAGVGVDRQSTRLNCSHVAISYAVFRLRK